MKICIVVPILSFVLGFLACMFWAPIHPLTVYPAPPAPMVRMDGNEYLSCEEWVKRYSGKCVNGKVVIEDNILLGKGERQ